MTIFYVNDTLNRDDGVVVVVLFILMRRTERFRCKSHKRDE